MKQVLIIQQVRNSFGLYQSTTLVTENVLLTIVYVVWYEIVNKENGLTGCISCSNPAGDVWFQQNSVLTHFCINVRNCLNKVFPNRLIGSLNGHHTSLT